MSKKHCFWSHDWDKWTEIERGRITSTDRYQLNPKERITGYFVRQQRICNKCGKLELDMQEIDLQS